MDGLELVTARFCLGMRASLIAIAWWVSMISSSFAHIRIADQLARETQGRSILTQIDSVADGVEELGRQSVPTH